MVVVVDNLVVEIASAGNLVQDSEISGTGLSTITSAGGGGGGY
jgi:hypothetical protein